MPLVVTKVTRGEGGPEQVTVLADRRQNIRAAVWEWLHPAGATDQEKARMKSEEEPPKAQSPGVGTGVECVQEGGGVQTGV